MSKADTTNMITVTFDDSARDFILESFDKTVDGEGYIVERSNQTQRVLTPAGQEIKQDKFAGVRKGSEIFIKSDIVSLIELCDYLKTQG